MKTRCFIDVNGHVWSINHKEESNFPGDINLVGDTVQVLGVQDCLGADREILEEYQLWPSLTSLAIAIEQNVERSDDGSVSLEQAIAEAHLNIQSFEKEWKENNARRPNRYPMLFSKDNAGVWLEFIHDHWFQ